MTERRGRPELEPESPEAVADDRGTGIRPELGVGRIEQLNDHPRPSHPSSREKVFMPELPPPGLSLDGYQIAALKTAQYPEAIGLYYLALGIAGEAGEICEKIKKRMRKGGDLTAEEKEALLYELGDELWYVAVLANHLGFDLSEVAEANLTKLRDRAQRDVIKGEGDTR